jgi:hypothetical protein
MIWYFEYEASIDLIIRLVTKFVESGFIIKLENLQMFVNYNKLYEFPQIGLELFIYIVEHATLSQTDLNNLLITVAHDYKRNLVQVRYLVELECASVTYVNDKGYTCVSNCYDEEILDYLFERGADIDSCIDSFVSICYNSESTNMIRFYVDHGINLNLSGHYYNSMLAPLEAINKNHRVPSELKEYMVEQHKRKIPKLL